MQDFEQAVRCFERASSLASHLMSQIQEKEDEKDKQRENKILHQEILDTVKDDVLDNVDVKDGEISIKKEGDITIKAIVGLSEGLKKFPIEEQVWNLYITLRQQGVMRTTSVKAVARQLNVSQKKIWEWKKTYNWDEKEKQRVGEIEKSVEERINEEIAN
ncbi:hypothetical protein DNK57_01995 [Methanothermobacter thermautotrophicus]|uniref:PBSX phage terminase small subunit-like N-terminal domain-containing protein n=1 Tax=Methanothermobacter thermautotrophicus TaxID=145262 RepID=A0A842YJD9_METTF|nr:phage terminase small subunit-related protein [Methanothermobacter thermautotrophicus]MBE2899602.1 hypothetical protein [Methanothermobacter thermautotrophicus]